MTASAPQPLEIRIDSAERPLKINFSTEKSIRYPAELLRAESPSTDVQGHSPSEKKIVAGQRNVAIACVEPSDNYSIVIKFDDGHDTGIFSWDYLYQLGL